MNKVYDKLGSWTNAFECLKKGGLIKLPEWKGYWGLEDNKIMMHCKDGTIMNITDTQDQLFTFGNIASNEWIVATTNNCPVLKNESIKIKELIREDIERELAFYGYAVKTYTIYHDIEEDKVKSWKLELCLLSDKKDLSSEIICINDRKVAFPSSLITTVPTVCEFSMEYVNGVKKYSHSIINPIYKGAIYEKLSILIHILTAYCEQ